KITILESSWVINSRSYATFKYNDYENLTSSVADTMVGGTSSTDIGAQLDINNLANMGYFTVPSIRTNSNAAYTQFAQPFIDKYGYLNTSGVRTGGGAVGGDPYAFDNIDFFRESFQAGYDFTMGDALQHDIHVGAQMYEDSEHLLRASNGWGQISIPHNLPNCPAAATQCAGKQYHFLAEFLRVASGVGTDPSLDSSFESTNLEINDTMRWGNWSFNVGLMLSEDTLFGQGLREDSSTVSGYVYSPGTRYEMYKIDFMDQVQPRVGATWAYNGADTVYASYARYNPAVTSLPRAASWDRSLFNQLYRVYFDATGKAIGTEAVGGSTGKLFVPDMDPRYTDEFVAGTSRQMTGNWTARAYGRYRYSTNFWEDTNNHARRDFNPPPGVSRELYIPNASAQLAQIGTGVPSNIYVIAEMEGAFTKFWEATLESDVKMGKASFNGTYTWSHYYGNFDQDNTTVVNDASSFVGSSNIGDSAGRQIWDNKYGDLRSDRRHLLKLYGYYSLPWNATVGSFALFQSGHAWESWNYEPYFAVSGSTNESNRYGEPAGSRRTDDHYQIDLNYTQNIPIAGLNLQLIGDIYNVTDNQTGYNPEPRVHNTNFGNPRSYYRPQRFQLAVRLQF
ncbi:MAG TPA: carboxypeptidase regulatory-like domain-containing protein, partial [Thermoanaerobaculia bacterium]|nr:carboxypeptidase regulatory-like domain-containing protein [Thermoanaerobaculia bacterium]